MGHNRFIVGRTFTVDELKDLHALARRGLAGFADRAANDPLRATFRDLATLPPLPASSPLAISAVSVTAVLAPSSAIWGRLADVVSRATAVSSLGQIDIGCAFEERGSEQESAEDGDWVHIAESRMGLSFRYRAGSSRVARDPGYRRDFMRRMVDELPLPLTVEDAPDGMRLRSGSEAQLRITQSASDDEPTGFNCEIRQSSLTAELARMKRFLDRFSGGTIFTFEWTASQGESDAELALGPPAAAAVLYDAVRSAGLPADAYTLHCSFTIDDLSGLDEVRRLSGPHDDAQVRLGDFDLSDGSWGDLTVLTSSGGHQLQLDLRVWDALPEVERQLGITFQEVEQP